MRARVLAVLPLLLVVLLGGCVSAQSEQQSQQQSEQLSGHHRVTAAPIIAAERAFAADAARRGWAAAFRATHAPGAIVLQPDPIEAAETLARVRGDGETTLDWRPAYAGISRSGDFGFTTGPFQIRGRDGIVGHYFTVWRRQADGSWKWIFDAGADVVDPGPAVAIDADIPALEIAGAETGSADTAIAEIAAIETQIATGNALPNEALARRLSDDARVHRVGAPRAIGKEASAALIAADRGVGYASLRREASAGGDMVFTMGEVRDQHVDAERLGYYARIWQRKPQGWRLVFDEIVPRRT